VVTRRPPGDPRGTRRTNAEPLTASWRLEPPPRRRPTLSVHNWRVYVIPLLIVLTVVVIVETARSGGSSPHSGAPVATEHAPIPVFTGSGTAVLPSGPAISQAGAGTWHIVPGSGPVIGKGPHVFRYQVAVEDGVDPASYGGDDAFARDVDATLADPRSWIAAGTVSLQRVAAGFPKPDFVISLTTPNTAHRPDLCGFDVRYESSCWRPSAHRIVIDLARWVRGALAFDGDLGSYRQFAINHAIGGVFGNPQVGCGTDGGLAPVMMQQDFGVADDYVHDVNQTDPTNRNRVARDGKVCHVNAWPYPQGPGVPANNPPN